MRIGALTATADLVGGRVRVGWTFEPEDGETVADVPPVTIRRKERDFAFPAPAAGDPYLLYDSAAFPPVPATSLEVHDLPGRELLDGANRITERSVTVARVSDGQRNEMLRQTIRTVFGPDRRATSQHVELLDVSPRLRPGVASYYELDSPALAGADRAAYRATATPGARYGLHRTLYELIPAIHRRHDTVARPADAGTGLIPEATVTGGQLRRLVDVFGMALDALRSSAEGLRALRDPAAVEPRFLPLLAQWIGWELTAASELPRQRNEIRNAARLYGAVGAVPGLRTIVDHYSGWSTRVCEFVQHIARTNVAPQRNVFAIVLRSGTWTGTDDTAPVLGFAAPNNVSDGSTEGAATLSGDNTEPFALRAGMTLTIAVDGGLPATITLGGDDFADIGAATAAEVAAVIALLRELDADAAGGAVRLRSHRAAADSRVEVVPSGPTVVSLNGAPGGRLPAGTDPTGRLWLAYATTAGAGPPGTSRLYVKPYLGRWHDSQPVPARTSPAQDAPALVALPDGDLLLAWVENPATAMARLRSRRGTPRPLTPARILGERAGPFELAAGERLVLTGYGATETFVVDAGDYLEVSAATAAEVAGAMNAQLKGVVTRVAGNGALDLQTADTGPDVALRVDLLASSVARQLGLGALELAGRGGWDEQVDWTPGVAIPTVGAGRHADTTAAVESDGAVRLLWSTHRDGLWRIARVRWDGSIRFATAAGAATRGPTGVWSTVTKAKGLPSNDVRALTVDGDGSTWYATAGGGAVVRANGAVTVLTKAATGGGLASDSVRGVAVAPDGTAWFAHVAGVSVREAGGVWKTVTTAHGLAGNDCRHVLLVDDTVWVASATGLARRDRGGRWAIIQSLPSGDVRQCAPAGDGAVWAATGNGLALVGDGGVRAVSLVAAGAAPGSDDVRGVAVAPADPEALGGELDTVWAATAAGVVEFVAQRRAVSAGPSEGLPGSDCRAVFVAGDGTIWAALMGGAARRRGDGSWEALRAADGLPSNDVLGLHGDWTVPLEFGRPDGGARDPSAAVDEANGLWVVWSQSPTLASGDDTWLLRARRLAAPGAAWASDPYALTSVAAGQRAADHHPHVAPRPGGGLRVYFDSDRTGGTWLWSLDVDAGNVASAPVALRSGTACDTNPTLVTFAGDDPVVLFRSDNSVPLARLGGGVPSTSPPTSSRRTPSEASVRRFAGATTVALGHLDRNRARREFDDQLCYTPQKPAAAAGAPLQPDELYTRGTIGLHVERGPESRPLTRADADRLRQLLRAFLPANLRAVVILRPSAVLLETVFDAANRLGDAYADIYPFAETLGALSDATAAALPDWKLFLATDSASITADPGDPTTMRRRTWHPPPG